MNWLEPGFPWKAICTIDNSGLGALSDFPVRVQLDHLLAHDVDSLRFYDADGTLLDHEVDSTILMGSFWRAEAWVKIPSISAGLTTQWFSVYWGNRAAASVENAAGVWDSDFWMVHHFSEQAGDYQDSTGNNKDLGNITITDRASRRIGYTPVFDGVDDKMDRTCDIGNQSAMTLEAFTKGDYPAAGLGGANKNSPMISDWNTWAPGSQEGFFLRFYWSNTLTRYETSAYFNDGTNTFGASVVQTFAQLNEWHSWIGTGNAANVRLFKDGVEINALGSGPAIIDVEQATPIYVGYGGVNAGYFYGQIDEVRISTIVRSDDWIEATSRCMHNTYVSVSNPIGCPPRGLLTSSGPQTLIRRNPERRFLVKELDRFPMMLPFTPVAPEQSQNKGDGS